VTEYDDGPIPGLPQVGAVRRDRQPAGGGVTGTAVDHLDVGAYLLGVLDGPGMTRFEDHLAGCPRCGRELDELAGVLPALAELGPPGGGVPVLDVRAAEIAREGGPPLTRLLAEVGAHRARRRRRTRQALMAVAVLVVGGPVLAVTASRHADGPDGGPSANTVAARHAAGDPVTGAHASIRLTATSWGSTVDLELTGVRGPDHCHLVAVGRNGSRETVSTWSVPAGGYDASGGRRPLDVNGASGFQPTDIRRFDVLTSAGRLLVSVPV
jgi:hypothetical protein